MSATYLVFVYGTLRKDESNNKVLADARLVAEEAWTSGRLYSTTSYYPVLEKYESGEVYGELYEVTKDKLEELDELEGYIGEEKDNLYDRIQQIIFTDKASWPAYVYVMTNKTLEMRASLIKSGDWKRHIR
ncbi:gamma-glutamylcyclotransferase [Virgibacillus halodenitrificans]|uniref:gamma-glutamylcyclotransferase family protein n=1 Tax=Virgibacillus halodenitrificans TaxID=1482 RepID=UPI001F1BC356|nr:gamma-glutamylcyclotransferase family protein [Virgibacillus halodenitrificans]MCG1028946.1 gamma-glutamylcyclotransferase [Virgibacillus halodenitrificans]MCJ0930703.1 gamma-glutamylcyclotransferase [Virgibacillus halodenitrificans]